MATRDREQPRNWFSPSEALRQLQSLGDQLTGAARSAADDLANSPAGQIAEPLARLGARTAELSTLWVAPMRAILEEQQELMDAVASWAEEQRKLADRFSELAERHRKMTEQVTAVITPALDRADQVAGRTRKKASAAKKTAK
jgi:hypothetical protein